MTLAEAIAVCDREYGDLVHSFAIDKEAEARESAIVIRESEAFKKSGVCEVFVEQIVDGTPFAIVLAIAFRFGMRVQRKLGSANASDPTPTETASKERQQQETGV